jgi:hypothetical protein
MFIILLTIEIFRNSPCAWQFLCTLNSAQPKTLGGFKMKNLGRVFFPTLVGLFLVVMACALQPTVTHGSAVLGLSSGQTPAAQEQTVSGKIASVEKNSFTLTVGQGQTSQQLEQTPSTPKTMSFKIDKSTTIDGSLKVGANADVTYRQEKGENIAISVRVTG